LKIVRPICGYQRGVCVICALLTHKDNVATQSQEVARRIGPEESELLLFRQPEGKALAKGAQRVRDNVDAFRELVMEDI